MTRLLIFVLLAIACLVSCRHVNEPETVPVVFSVGSGFAGDSVAIQLDGQTLLSAIVATQDDGFAWISEGIDVSRSSHRFTAIVLSSGVQDSIVFMIDAPQSVVADFDRSAKRIGWRRLDYLVVRNTSYPL